MGGFAFRAKILGILCVFCLSGQADQLRGSAFYQPLISLLSQCRKSLQMLWRPSPPKDNGIDLTQLPPGAVRGINDLAPLYDLWDRGELSIPLPHRSNNRISRYDAGVWWNQWWEIPVIEDARLAIRLSVRPYAPGQDDLSIEPMSRILTGRRYPESRGLVTYDETDGHLEGYLFFQRLGSAWNVGEFGTTHLQDLEGVLTKLLVSIVREIRQSPTQSGLLSLQVDPTNTRLVEFFRELNWQESPESGTARRTVFLFPVK